MPGELDYRVGLQIDELRREVDLINRQFARIGKGAEEEGKKIDRIFRNIGAGVAGYLSVRTLFEYSKQIALVRGEFQQLSVSFETMLRSKARADALMRDVVELAATTPFKLQDVGSGAKQLLAYGVAAEDITKTLTQLGDIASGLNIPLGDLTYLYGTTLTQGRLYTRDLLQFTSRGIPLMDELAKIMKVQKSEIQGLVEAGRVGFPEVQKAIENMTGETGKFYDLMAKQSKTITGQISNLGDAFDKMLNDIGQANEGIIGDAIGGARYLIEHYEEVAKILGVLVTMYGSYKAAVILTAAAQRASVSAGNIRAWFQLAAGIRSAKDAQIALNLAVKANPLGLLASAIATVVTAFILFRKEAQTAEEKLTGLRKATDEYSKSSANLDNIIDEYEKLSKKESKTADETERLTKATRELANTVPDAITEFDTLNNTLDLSIEKLREYSKSRKESLARVLESSIEENQAELERLNKLISRQQKLAEEGVVKTTSTFVSSSGASQTIEGERKLSKQERNEADKERQRLEQDRDNLIQDIEKAKNTLRGITQGQSDAQKKELQSINDLIIETEKNIAKYKQTIKDLRSGNQQTSDIVGDIEKAEASLKTEQSKLVTLTGEKIKKTNLDNLREQRRKLADEAEQMEIEVDQAKIDAMKDGLQKTLAQNELNFRKELSQIAQHRKERELELQKAGITSDDSEYYEAMTKAAQDGYAKANQEAIKAEKEKNKELIREFETLQQKRERIYEDYKSKIDKLQKAGGTNENVIQAQTERDDALARIDEEFANREASFRVWAENLTNIGLKELVSALETANTALGTADEYGLSEKERTILRAKINILQGQIEELQARAADSPKEGNKEWGKTLKVMNQVQEQVGYIISDFDNLDDITKVALQSATNIAGGIIGMITGIKTLAIAGAEAIKGVERASVILAVIGAAIQVFNAISGIFRSNAKAEKEHQEALREATRRKVEAQRTYNQLLLEQNLLLKEAESIFGADQITKAANAYKVYKDAMSQFKQELVAFDFIKIVTGSKTVSSGFLGLGKKQVDVYSKLTDVYDDLIDSEGMLNEARVKAILQTEKMSDYNRELLESLLELNEAAKEAQDQLSEYLKDTFGDLGNDIMESLANAIRDGSDAWVEFGKAGAKVLEDLGQQIAYTLFFSDQFKKLEKELESIYSSGASEEQIGNMARNVVQWFYQGIGTQVEAAQSWLEEWQRQAANAGFDLFSGTATREAASRGIASISQDSADEMNGRFTVIQGHTMHISESMGILTQNSQSALNHLAAIEVNTDRLAKIESDMASVKSGINTITTQGIKLK